MRECKRARERESDREFGMRIEWVKVPAPPTTRYLLRFQVGKLILLHMRDSKL